MRIGINSGAASGPETTIAGLIARAQKMEQLGFDTFWMANMFGLDAMTALALVGQATQRIKLGIAQAFALIPGTSRSGATIIGGLLFGLSRRAGPAQIICDKIHNSMRR